jgi:outer membrane protein TolC
MNLRVAEHQFAPQGLLGGSADAFDPREGEPAGTTTSETGSLTVTQQLPTGGAFQFSWSGRATGAPGPAGVSSASSWKLSAVQPLLRGGGTTVGTASLTLARIAERGNVLQLRSTLMSIVSSVILAFRALVLAQRDVVIREAALERARQLLEINKTLIDAGRMAPMELVQAEADIASRDLGLVTGRNSLDNARLALLQLLTLDKTTQVELVEETGEGDRPPGIEDALAIAFRERPDYEQALLSVKAAERNLAVARNGRLWDLSLEGGLSRGVTGASFWDAVSNGEPLNVAHADWYAGISLSIPLNDLSRKQAWVSASVSLESARLDLLDRKDAVETEVRNAVRNADIARRQLEIARLSLSLTERKLEIEREKLRTGRSTNFQVVNFQNDLVSAQTTELSALIDYRNALTNLDLALGTTLATWQIEVHEQDETPPGRPGAEAKR